MPPKSRNDGALNATNTSNGSSNGDTIDVDGDDCSTGNAENEVGDDTDSQNSSSGEEESSSDEHTGTASEPDVGPKAIVNTLLTYTQYCMTCSTPDNTKQVICSHFSPEEIIEAKDILYDVMGLPKGPQRTKSSKRSADMANVTDIMGALYNQDLATKKRIFHIDPRGVARLPRFNPESLNIVALDQRIAELSETCQILRAQIDSYRTMSMRCSDRLDTHDTVLLQHTNNLRNMGYGANTTISNANIPKQSCHTSQTNQHSPISNERSPTNSPRPNIRVPESLSATLSVNASKPKPATPSTVMTSFPPHKSDQPKNDKKTNRRQGNQGTTAPVSVPKTDHDPPLMSSLFSYTNKLPPHWPSFTDPNQPKRRNPVHQMEPADDTFYAFSKYNTSADNTENQKPSNDEDEFTMTRSSLRNERRRENRRHNVVKGKTVAINSLFCKGGTPEKFGKCDIFLYRVHRNSTMQNIKRYMSERHLDLSKMRVDVTSPKDAECKSYRIIAPIEYEERLLDEAFWPKYVKSKEFIQYNGRSTKKNIQRGGRF